MRDQLHLPKGLFTLWRFLVPFAVAAAHLRSFFESFSHRVRGPSGSAMRFSGAKSVTPFSWLTLRRSDVYGSYVSSDMTAPRRCRPQSSLCKVPYYCHSDLRQGQLKELRCDRGAFSWGQVRIIRIFQQADIR